MKDYFLGDAFWVLSCPARLGVLFCSVVLGCRQDTHLKLLDPAVSGARFLTGDVFEGNIIAHRRSVAVLCKLNKIRLNPMHPLYGAIPVPLVPVPVGIDVQGTNTNISELASRGRTQTFRS